MTTLVIVVLSLVAAEAATAPDRTPRHESSGLRARVDAVGPWCRGRPRFDLTLENVTGRPIWIALGESSRRPIEWTEYSYSYGRTGGGERAIGDTDVPTVLSFLRGGLGVRLAPGASASWQLQVAPQAMQAGRVAFTIYGPVLGTANLDESRFTVYDFRADLSVALSRSGRCYAVRPG